MHLANSSKWMIVAAILGLAAAPHLRQIFAERGTCTDTDDGLQVAATINWHTTGRHENIVPTTSLSGPREFSKPANWPMSYGFLVLVLLKLGVSVKWAVTLWKIIFFLAAIIGWYALSREVLGRDVWAAIAILPITWRISMYPADLLCCAISPLLIIFLIRILSKPDYPKFRALARVATIVAALVALKYSALYFVPGVWLIVVIHSFRSRRLFRGFASATVVVLPALIVFLASYYPNLRSDTSNSQNAIVQTGPLDVLDHGVEDVNVFRLVTLPVTTFVLEPLKLTSVVRAVNRRFGSSTFLPWLWLKRLMNTVLVLIIGSVFVFFANSRDNPETARWLLVVVITLGLACAAFLIAVDLNRGGIGHVRTYRYYSPVAPAILIVLLHTIRRLLGEKTLRSYIALLSLVALGLPFTTWMIQQAWATARYPDLQYEQGMRFIREVSDNIAGDDPTVFLGHIRTFCQSDLPFANLPDGDEFWNAARADSTVWIFLALNQYASSESYVEATRRLAQEFNANGRQQGSWEIYYRKFAAGKLRPAPMLP